MSYPYSVASAEFAALCQAQIKLLSKGLGAMWSAVYLTEEVAQRQEKQLLLFAIYPQNKTSLPPQISEIELPKSWQYTVSQRQIAPSSLLVNHENQEEVNLNLPPDNLATKQLILPLIHEEVMMGLLVTSREDRDWNQQELEQARAIASTLAIAIFVEKQSQWYQNELRLQQEINHWQQEQLGNLLHQLRNPLTALRTFSKLLLKRLLPEDRNQSVAESILRESDRLSALIDRFAEKVDDESAASVPVTLSTTSVRLSETEAKHHSNFLLPGDTGELDSIDVAEILESLSNATEAIAESQEINLVTEIPPNLPLVRGNARALREVLNNLLDNAVKYTPQKGQITVRIICQDSRLGIAIEDTGYGILEADREHLFERHYRGVQAKGDIPGTGLGLAIAKQLMNQMQGEIEVVSPNNHSNNSNFPGTIFIIWLSIIQN